MRILTLSTVAKYLSVLLKCAKWCMQYHISNQSKSSSKVPLRYMCLVLVILYGADVYQHEIEIFVRSHWSTSRGRQSLKKKKKKGEFRWLSGMLVQKRGDLCEADSSAWYLLRGGNHHSGFWKLCLIPVDFVMLSKTLKSISVQWNICQSEHQ